MTTVMVTGLVVLLAICLSAVDSANGGDPVTIRVLDPPHSIVGGSAWEPTPWRAVQRAAWATLKKQVE
jgi:hypothetical protein